jgi:hypothetical protein
MADDDDRVFKALADPTRRFLLDQLFAHDAGLVVARRSGREKLHFLNPVPIRLIHDRWIDKYTERRVSALTDLKSELEGTA